MAADCTSRSTSWNDKITNHRGKNLEEFIASNNLNVINGGNGRTNFQSRRGKSNTAITITNNQMLGDVKIGTYPRGKAHRITTK